MRVLLVAPPVGNIGQAPPGISVLAAWLRARGHDCQQWDLGIEAFHHFHSHEQLTRAARQLSSEADHESSAGFAQAVASEIEQAKAALRRPGTESDLETMSRALATIRAAGRLISASHGGAELAHNGFDITGALASWESLPEALNDERRNLLLPYLRERAVPRVQQVSPDVVGISITYHSQLLAGLTLAWLLKKAHTALPVLLGGAYLKAIKEDLAGMPCEVVPADGICVGDGEATLAQYLEVVQGTEELRRVPNLLVPQAGQFRATGCWQATVLDEAPVPALDLQGLELADYLVPRYAVPLPITRGCHWHRCVYCNISNQARETYRHRLTELCLDDIEALTRQWDTNWFDFPTDSVLPRDLRRLAQGLIDRKLGIRWAAEVVPDRRLSDELIELLGRSGCCGLRFGLESACRATLEAMDKAIDPDEISRIVKACRGHGIKTGAMVIVGFPTETQAELNQTVEFLEEHAAYIDFVALHPFSLVPGSRLAAQPELAGVYLLPRRAVLTPSRPYAHTNPVAMRPEDLPSVIEAIKQALSGSYPQSGQLWTCGIGGWLTFAASCHNEPEFFKRPLPAA